MIQAGMITHTSIADFLEMPIGRFFNVFIAIAEVLEKRRRQ